MATTGMNAPMIITTLPMVRGSELGGTQAPIMTRTLIMTLTLTRNMGMGIRIEMGIGIRRSLAREHRMALMAKVIVLHGIAP